MEKISAKVSIQINLGNYNLFTTETWGSAELSHEDDVADCFKKLQEQLCKSLLNESIAKAVIIKANKNFMKEGN